MDMNRYCRRCGHPVEFEYSETETHCPKCNATIPRSDTIAGWAREARINQLKAMHNLMLEANDELIDMRWTCLMPDCPMEEDFIDIASDDEQYNECFDLFVKLIAKNGNRWKIKNVIL